MKIKTLVNNYLNYDPNPPTIIYQYCSIETLLSILNNKCLWLSDSAKTNDNTEIHWILNNISEVFNETLEMFKSEFDRKLLNKIKIKIEEIIGHIHLYENPSLNDKKNFLICFSENGDLLSQWRAYGSNGYGVSIGFCSEFFCIFKNREGYEFTKVIYDTDTTKSFLHKVIDEQLKYIIMDFNDHNHTEKDYFNTNLQIGLLIDSLYKEGFAFKNHHFHEESEWRLFRSVSPSNYDDSDGIDEYGYSDFIEGIFNDNTKYLGDFSRSKIKFRASDCDLKSYMEIGFEKIKSKLIKEIILGPKCKINPLDLKLYLAENQYIENIYDDSIIIKKSSIPYI